MQNFLKLFINWNGAVRQQAITWTNVDKDVCHHMVSPGINELTYNIYNLMTSHKMTQLYQFAWISNHTQ